MALAVLLDGVAVKNTNTSSEVRNGEVRVRHSSNWFAARFDHLGPGGVVALPYASFTNTAGIALPAEAYSPAEIDATGQSPPRSEVAQQNHRWTTTGEPGAGE